MMAYLLLMASLCQSAPAARASSTVPLPLEPTAKNVTVEADDPAALLKMKRIYVDSFGDDTTSRELQSMIVSSLVATKRFKVTENRDKADAILKGVALEKTSQELHGYGESTSVGTAGGGSHGEVSGSVINGNGSISGSSSGGFIARHMGTSDSSVHTETINDARIAIRLVTPDGDVIWTTTQESKGAKYKGASADVADQCIKQLLRDVTKLESSSATAPTSSGSTPQAH